MQLSWSKTVEYKEQQTQTSNLISGGFISTSTVQIVPGKANDGEMIGCTANNGVTANLVTWIKVAVLPQFRISNGSNSTIVACQECNSTSSHDEVPVINGYILGLGIPCLLTVCLVVILIVKRVKEKINSNYR